MSIEEPHPSTNAVIPAIFKPESNGFLDSGFLIKAFGNDKTGTYEFLEMTPNRSAVILPNSKDLYPHENALDWHRKNIFHK